ncbi:MAG: DUF4173 domain-containing protein [Planctomycetota bacterium]
MSADGAIDHKSTSAQQEEQPTPDAPALNSLEGWRFRLLIVISLTFVVLTDWLFWDCARGWTVGAYGLLLTGTLLIWGRAFSRSRATLLVTLALAVLCLQCVEEPNLLAVVYGVFGLATLSILAHDGWSASAVTWVQRWALWAAMGWQMLFWDVASWHRRRHTSSDRVSPGMRVLRNWLIPILLGAVFLALFAVANPVMSKWLGDAWREVHRLFRQLTERFPSGWRIVQWALVTLAVWALLRFRLGTRAASPGKGSPVDATWAGHPKPSLVVRCLVLFNLLFAVETGLDLYYLWGGGTLPNGLTYAQYAHRGAYPLIAAAILAALFVLAAFRSDPREKSLRVCRGLVYVWLIQTLFLVVSAGWRLRLYVDVYTLTRLRVAAAIWMLLVFCGILWILVRIVAGRSNLWLININTITALLVLFVCCFVNFDGLIARHNVLHCREMRGDGPRLDVAYLESLGPDTLPALMQLVGKTRDSSNAPRVQDAIERLRADLEADLSSWHGWTWRRQRLLRLDFPTTETGPSVQR